ncbi:MAG: lantibiotic immunity ABC transporter MutE/EpiE family permease subunit [Lachnospiraceae bacterium]
MLRIAMSEHLKMRHTFVGKLPVIAPVFSLCLVFLLAYRAMDMVPPMAWNFWYTILLPGMVAIICCLGVNKDKKLHYCNMLSVPFPAAKCLAGKLLYYSAGLFFANMVLCAGIFISGKISGTAIGITGSLLAVILLSFVFLWEIPLYIMLSIYSGMSACLISCMFMVFSGVLLANTRLWWIWPPSIPARLMCPVLGIMPNGILAPEGSPLLDSNVILPGIIISFIWFVLMAFIMVLCFNKKVVEE